MSYQWQGQDLVLQLWVQTRASATEWAGTQDDALKLRVTAAPLENKANQAIIKFLAKCFAVPKSRVELLGGEHHRRKRVLIRQPKQLPHFIQAPDA